MALIRCAVCTDVISSLVQSCPSCRTVLPVAGDHAANPRSTERPIAPRRATPPVKRVSHFPTRA